MITLGIDIGSRNTKVVLYDTADSAILFSAYRSTDVSPLTTVDALIQEAYSTANITEADATACTGYGRKLYKSPAKVLSEISCHAAGVRHFLPGCVTIIDIGGQDSKIITLSPAGKVLDFVMNDKCAAGTGRFLEMTAIKLGCSLDELSTLAAACDRPLDISSTCVVFAESEIIGMISAGHSSANIVCAVHESVCKRVLTQLSGLSYLSPIAFTGGVAQNSDLVMRLGRHLEQNVSVPSSPEITGALGAAILAAL